MVYLEFKCDFIFFFFQISSLRYISFLFLNFIRIDLSLCQEGLIVMYVKEVGRSLEVNMDFI